jgi:hypothetical protein
MRNNRENPDNPMDRHAAADLVAPCGMNCGTDLMKFSAFIFASGEGEGCLIGFHGSQFVSVHRVCQF